MVLTLIASVLALQSDDLAEAAKKSSTLESYAFKVETKLSRGKQQLGAIKGIYQKDQPLSLKTAGVEGFKKGEKKQQPVAAAFSGVKLPHEELEGFEKSFEKVEKAAEKDKDCSVWSGTLTPSAAHALVSTGGKTEGKSNATYTGTARVWVNDQGLIVRYEVVAHMKGETKKGPVEADITRTVSIAEAGAAKVGVPEPAAKLLISQS